MENSEEMDKFLDTTYQDWTMKKIEKIENLSKPIKNNKIKPVIKCLPSEKIPGPDDFTAVFCQTFKEN